MSNCPANTAISDQSQYGQIPADIIQGVINRLQAYWDKYNITSIQAFRRISSTYVRLPDDAGDQPNTKLLASMISDLHSYMDDYKDQTAGSGGDFTWTSSPQNSKVQPYVANELKANLEGLEAQCWACVGPSSAGDNSCTCYTTCHQYVHCACNQTCYTVGCYCNAVQYVHTCTCDVANFDAGTWGGVPFCGCYGACHGNTCTWCNITCYDQSHCYTCNAACYGYSCTCHNVCYAHICHQCHTTTY